MFTRVLAVWNDEAKVEVKTLEQPVPEVMPLDHSKVTDWFITHHKLYPVTTHEEQKTKSTEILLGASDHIAYSRVDIISYENDDINHTLGYQVKICHFVQLFILFSRVVSRFKNCKISCKMHNKMLESAYCV